MDQWRTYEFTQNFTPISKALKISWIPMDIRFKISCIIFKKKGGGGKRHQSQLRDLRELKRAQFLTTLTLISTLMA